MKICSYLLVLLVFWGGLSHAQTPSTSYVNRVNVFLGSSGDHGQLSPAASYPFGMLSIGPQTYPNAHMGYDNRAKLFLGFTHNRFEGVGCRGSGGNILIKPFTGKPADSLLKDAELAGPGWYSVSFLNGIGMRAAVAANAGIEVYSFPGATGTNGFTIDLSHAFANGFIDEGHVLSGGAVSGWIESGTTCHAGAFKLYYYIHAEGGIKWSENGKHHLYGELAPGEQKATLRIGISSVDVEHAHASLFWGGFTEMQARSSAYWNELLGTVDIKGNEKEGDLFYSLLYRTLQSPYNISETDGSYRALDGSLQKDRDTVYNGWAIWDNYRTQLPLLALAYPSHYRNIANSLVRNYKSGKGTWPGMHEPSNSVRNEHAIVTLLDAYRKGFPVDLRSIVDSLRREADSLEFTRPDKILESCIDAWGMSEIYGILGNTALQKVYSDRAASYRTVWQKEFADLTKNDVEKMGARGMYQGNIWQYRWLVPFDLKGLVALAGGDSAYRAQLDAFFAGDYYNAGNETDIQVPAMYNVSSEPWKSQALIRRYATDTVIQWYSDQNLRGVEALIGRVFNNQPEAFIRGMDDDAGAMSAWYVFAGMGLHQPCVGQPVYFLSVPLFSEVWVKAYNFRITVRAFDVRNRYIKAVWLNGKSLNRNWITQDEIKRGGELVIEASATPNKDFGRDRWVSELK